MALKYVERRAATDQQTEQTPSATVAKSKTVPRTPVPWRGVLTAIVFPIVGIVLGALLFAGINVNDWRVTALTAATPANVRTIVEKVVKSDLTADRLNEVFGAKAASGVRPLCTSDASASPSDPPSGQSPAKQSATDKSKSKAPAPTVSAPTEQQLACRALLAKQLADQPSSALVQGIVGKMVGSPVEAQFWAEGSKLILSPIKQTDMDEVIKGWLKEFSQDPFAAKVVAGAAFEPADNGLQQRVGRVLSAETLEDALKRELGSDFSGAMTGSGVSVWSKDVTARLVWATMMFVFCGAFIFVMAAAFDQLLQLPRKETRFWLLTAVVVIGALLAAILWWFDDVTVNITTLDQALQFVAKRYGVNMPLILRALKFVLVVGTVFLIVGSVATFVIKVNDDKGVTLQLTGLRGLFNAGVVFMLTSVLAIDALYRWPAVFQGTNAQALIDAANGVATAFGAVFTVVLLAVYLSSVTVLRDQVRHIEDQTTRENAAKVFDNISFGPGGTQLLMRLAQALAPVLAGLALTTFSSS
jgi:hypothetical protein